MDSDIGVGDTETPYLDVSPADGTTLATLTVTAPDGTPTPVTMTAGPLKPSSGLQTQRWTATTPVVYTQPGRWVLHFVVTGTGEGSEDVVRYVTAAPAAGGPTWLPGRSRVATYVPHRTLARDLSTTTTGADSYQTTFDDTTTPPGPVVDRLVADGAAWVLGRVGTLPTPLGDMASVVVSLYAAAAVERGWPDGDQSLARANDLERRMDAMLATLAEASDAAGGTGIDVVYPVWSFPAADARWDYGNYF